MFQSSNLSINKRFVRVISILITERVYCDSYTEPRHTANGTNENGHCRNSATLCKLLKKTLKNNIPIKAKLVICIIATTLTTFLCKSSSFVLRFFVMHFKQSDPL